MSRGKGEVIVEMGNRYVDEESNRERCMGTRGEGERGNRGLPAASSCSPFAAASDYYSCSKLCSSNKLR